MSVKVSPVFDDFVNQLRAIRFSNTFNPYKDRCGLWDLPKAPVIRASLLNEIIIAAKNVEIDSIWVGRDLGYRGGRRTGLALTDEIHAEYYLRRWNLYLDDTRSTIGEPVAERTAKVIWDFLSRLKAPIFLWNVFPFHPHMPDDPMSNRAHNKMEGEIGQEILFTLCKLLKPRRLVAIGNDAEVAALKVYDSRKVKKIRHPSYGGKSEFLLGMQALYGKP